MKINLKNLCSNLTKPAVLAPTVFLAVGTGKIGYDYNKAKPQNKKRVLIKDTAIIAGSTIGFALVNPLTKFICNNYSFKNKIMKSTEYILKQTFAGTFNTFAAIAGAIYSNALVHKYILDKTVVRKAEEKNLQAKTEQEHPRVFHQSNVFKNFNYVNKQFASQTANVMLSTALYVPAMKVFNPPLMALSGFSIANTKGYHNKLKKTTYELLANTLIPSIVISAVSLAIESKKNVKDIVKYPLLGGAICLGSYIGTKVANKYKDQIDDKIDGMDLKYIAL